MLTLTLAALLGLTFSTPALAGEVVFGIHNEIGIGGTQMKQQSFSI